MEIIFFVLVVPAIVNAVMASNKGRSVGGWIVLSLFIGWWATLILALSGAIKNCPKCKKDIPREAIVCSYCGNDKLSPKTKIA